MQSKTLIMSILIVLIIPFDVNGLQISGRRRVQLPGIDKINIFNPQWSRNGRYLSFETIDEENHRIYILDADRWTPPVEITKSQAQSEPSRTVSSKLTPKKKDGQTTGPRFEEKTAKRKGRQMAGPRFEEKTANLGLVWICDISDSELLFISHDDMDRNIFYKKSLDSPAQPMLLRTGEFLTADNQPFFVGLSYIDLDISSKTLIFNAGKNEQIKVFRWQGALVECQNSLPRISKPVEVRISESGILPFEPLFNPVNSTLIAFSGDLNNNLDIFVYDASLKKSARLTDWPSVENFPRWSPDGKRILFLSDYGHSEQAALYVMDRSGSNKKKICDWINDDQAEFVPVWGADGKMILYIEVRNDGGMPLRCYETGSGKTSSLETGCIAHTAVAVSRDAKKIAFCARAEETGKNLTWRNLYVADLER